MSFAIATSTELLKTKRSASFWLSIIGALFLPGIFFLVYTFNAEEAVKDLGLKPWKSHFEFGWNALSAFLFPIFVILVCTLIPQIEFKNNTWKQVFAAPQSYGNIYFSKFVTIHILILFFYLLFNIFMILSGLVANLIHPEYTFLKNSIDWQMLMKLNVKTYVSILGISAIQYCVAMRFKNFIAPMGIGLGLLVGSIVALGFHWDHVYKLPFAHPVLTLKYASMPGRPFLENHEINSLLFFVAFIVIGFLDLRLKKEKG